VGDVRESLIQKLERERSFNRSQAEAVARRRYPKLFIEELAKKFAVNETRPARGGCSGRLQIFSPQEAEQIRADRKGGSGRLAGGKRTLVHRPRGALVARVN